MKKITILAQLPPPVHGASIINQAVHDTLSKLNKCSIEHIELSTSNSITQMQKSPILKSIKSIIPTTKNLFKIIAKKKDITYINASPNSASSIRDLAFILLSNMRSKEIFIHFHGRLAQNSIYLNSVISKIVPQKAKFIFLDNKLIPEKFIAIHGSDRIAILKNFSTTEGSSPPPKNRESQNKTVAFLANMLPSKGIVDFLEVCASILRENYDFSVAIAGGWTKKYTENEYNSWLEINPDIKHKFTHIGQVDQIQKIKFLSDADIFFYPTQNDAFPLVLLEAMENGAAVVASDVGAIMSIVSDSTLIFPFEDREPFAKAIKNLLNDPILLRKKKEELRARYYKEFSRSKFEADLLNILGLSR